MLSEPRAIFFQTELEWPPVEAFDFRIGKDLVRRFYNKMFEPEFEEYHYENLELQSPAPTLATRSQTRESICQFKETSILIEERRPDFEITRFKAVVQSVLRSLRTVCGEIPDYNVPPFLLQRCRIQCLSQPGSVKNSLDLLAAKVARVKEPIAPFERPPSFFGVRFRFGPVVMLQNGGEERRMENFASVRFETYSDDPSQVWMEVASTYPVIEEPVTLADEDKIVANIEESYDFLTTRCKAFLDQFDESNRECEEQPD